jgi:hypothetical protein
MAVDLILFLVVALVAIGGIAAGFCIAFAVAAHLDRQDEQAEAEVT